MTREKLVNENRCRRLSTTRLERGGIGWEGGVVSESLEEEEKWDGSFMSCRGSLQFQIHSPPHRRPSFPPPSSSSSSRSATLSRKTEPKAEGHVHLEEFADGVDKFSGMAEGTGFGHGR
jgi:hypothetical protein